MRLRTEEVELIVKRIQGEWLRSHEATFPHGDAAARIALVDIFVTELKVEDDINAQTEKMLSKYESEFASGKLDRRKMFQMIKNQLVKEKKVIL